MFIFGFHWTPSQKRRRPGRTAVAELVVETVIFTLPLRRRRYIQYIHQTWIQPDVVCSQLYDKFQFNGIQNIIFSPFKKKSGGQGLQLGIGLYWISCHPPYRFPYWTHSLHFLQARNSSRTCFWFAERRDIRRRRQTIDYLAFIQFTTVALHCAAAGP